MIDPLSANRVAVLRDRGVRGYPDDPPYGPGERYPEYPFAWPEGRSAEGRVYGLVRDILYKLELDRSRFGTPGWNPMGEFISPGDTVLVKPNWVIHQSRSKAPAEALFVNAVVIRPVLDYISIALNGRGRIILADAPLQSADFGLILEQAGIPALERFWAGSGKPALEIRDLRRSYVTVSRGDRISSQHSQEGDPEGYGTVDLGARSHLTPLDSDYQRFRVTNYQPAEMFARHKPGVHQYLIPNSVLCADAVVNLAKLKTHRKGGITCALKNMVGINGNKDWLPHHRTGSLAEGGDEYAYTSFFKRLASSLSDRLASRREGFTYNILWYSRYVAAALASLSSSDPYTEGSWYGNDTLWRMVLDLNTVLLYGNSRGELSSQPAKRNLAIVDAVVAGEGDGPLNPSPRQEGMLIAGANPLAVDAVSSTLIGHDLRKIPTVVRGFEPGRGADMLPLATFPWQEVEILSNVTCWHGRRLEQLESIEGRLDFAPAPGWRSHVELKLPATQNDEECSDGTA